MMIASQSDWVPNGDMNRNGGTASETETDPKLMDASMI